VKKIHIQKSRKKKQAWFLLNPFCNARGYVYWWKWNPFCNIKDAMYWWNFNPFCNVWDVATLAQALIQRIQWPKDKIIIPPMTRHPNPEVATGSRGTTSNGGAAAQCQQEKAQQ
jgi:hypothetical protein